MLPHLPESWNLFAVGLAVFCLVSAAAAAPVSNVHLGRRIGSDGEAADADSTSLGLLIALCILREGYGCRHTIGVMGATPARAVSGYALCPAAEANRGLGLRFLHGLVH